MVCLVLLDRSVWNLDFICVDITIFLGRSLNCSLIVRVYGVCVCDGWMGNYNWFGKNTYKRKTSLENENLCGIASKIHSRVWHIVCLFNAFVVWLDKCSFLLAGIHIGAKREKGKSMKYDGCGEIAEHVAALLIFCLCCIIAGWGLLSPAPQWCCATYTVVVIHGHWLISLLIIDGNELNVLKCKHVKNGPTQCFHRCQVRRTHLKILFQVLHESKGRRSCSEKPSIHYITRCVTNGVAGVCCCLLVFVSSRLINFLT